MQRTITVCGVEFDVEYEWDDECLVLESMQVCGQEVIEVLAQKVIEKAEETLYGLYGEDMADRADYLYQINKEMRRAA